MVIFHIVYDLTVFNLISFNDKHFLWEQFNNLIIFLFLFCSGISLQVCHHKGIRWEVVKKQILKLGISALLISLVTYFSFPTKWIYFGTLHCILASYLVGLLFINKPVTALVIALINYASLYFTYGTPIDFPRMNDMGSLDHIPIYPFGAALLVGIYTASKRLQEKKIPVLAGKDILIKLGQNSLKIYLGHQLIIYPVIMGISWLINN